MASELQNLNLSAKIFGITQYKKIQGHIMWKKIADYKRDSNFSTTNMPTCVTGKCIRPFLADIQLNLTVCCGEGK